VSGANPTMLDPKQRLTVDPNSLEVVKGFERDHVEGSVPQLASEEDLRNALESAFSYRGDVTITRKDGSQLEGYIFDRRTAATLDDSRVRIIPKNERTKVEVAYSEIAALAFTGRDMAAGKSWETWVKNYWEKRAAGEKNIGLKPESLEE